MQHHISFRYALAGLRYAFTSQPNFRVHLLATCIVLLSGWYFELNRIEWVIVLFTCSLVIVAELLNTAIESVVDLVTDVRHQHAKHAKDVSAGMVLLAACMAVIIAGVLFIPKILASYA